MLTWGIGGGVSTATLAIGKALGARVLVTSSSDAKLERDEWYAALAADRAWERAVGIEAGDKPEWEDVEFKLVERTVVLDLP